MMDKDREELSQHVLRLLYLDFLHLNQNKMCYLYLFILAKQAEDNIS